MVKVNDMVYVLGHGNCIIDAIQGDTFSGRKVGKDTITVRWKSGDIVEEESVSVTSARSTDDNDID